ncbi:hypothetical protein GQ42DRAFT_124036, partial [Ramicandelaber brevisporus]
MSEQYHLQQQQQLQQPQLQQQQQLQQPRQLPNWPPLAPLQPAGQQRQTSSVTDPTSSDAAPSTSQQSSAALKVAKTCDRCRQRKIKCSGDRPTCTTCAKFDALCAYSHIAPRR